MITKEDWQDKPQGVAKAFLDHYQHLLGSNVQARKIIILEIVYSGPLVTDEHINLLSVRYTAEEVKNALFSIPGSNTRGPNDFGSYFYRDA